MANKEVQATGLRAVTAFNRRLITTFVLWQADNPHTPGDFTDRDESLRIRQIQDR